MGLGWGLTASLWGAFPRSLKSPQVVLEPSEGCGVRSVEERAEAAARESHPQGPGWLPSGFLQGILQAIRGSLTKLSLWTIRVLSKASFVPAGGGGLIYPPSVRALGPTPSIQDLCPSTSELLSFRSEENSGDSSVAGVLENDDLLAQILIRIPLGWTPGLPGQAMVCRRWRALCCSLRATWAPPPFVSVTEAQMVRCLRLFPCLSHVRLTHCCIPTLSDFFLGALAMHLPGLTTLHVSCNISRSHVTPHGLTSLFQNLPSLKEFIFDTSLSLTLPESISSLRHLESLGAGSLVHPPPAALFSLTSLRSLHLRFSKSECAPLPHDLSRLTRLTHLSLQHHGTSPLPEDLGLLPELRSLSLALPRASLLPQGVALLPRLRCLELVRCARLVSLPEGIGGLSSLESLVVSQATALTRLPDAMSSLKALKFLRIEWCPILLLPPGLDGLRDLRTLIVRRCAGLLVVPSSLCQLARLERLAVSECDRVVSLPEAMGQLRSLRELDLSFCKELLFLPPGLARLPALARINLDGCARLGRTPWQLEKMAEDCQGALGPPPLSFFWTPWEAGVLDTPGLGLTQAGSSE